MREEVRRRGEVGVVKCGIAAGLCVWLVTQVPWGEREQRGEGGEVEREVGLGSVMREARMWPLVGAWG